MLYLNYALIMNGSAPIRKIVGSYAAVNFMRMNLNPNEMKHRGFDQNLKSQQKQIY